MTSICIDGMNLALRRGTGVASYGRSLLKAAGSLGMERHVLFGPSAALSDDAIVAEAALIEDETVPAARLRPIERLRRRVDIFSSQIGRKATPLVPSGRVIWPDDAPPTAELFWLSRNLFRHSRTCFRLHGRFTPLSFADAGREAPDIMHFTTPLPLYARGRPNVVTIHDLVPLRLPHSTSHDRNLFMRLYQEIALRADRIAVVSEATRRDVVEMLGVPDNRIVTTYQSVNLPEAFAAIPAAEVNAELENTFGLDWGRYFLHFGAIEPKKNLSRLVEAYLAACLDTPLVVVGGPGWMGADEMSLLNQHRRVKNGGSIRVHFFEYTSLRMLISLIRGARATLFPSLYEGFGLPVIESMALGTPVLTSTRGSLPEIAGDAALTVEPYDIDALKRAIVHLDSDEDLRRHLTDRGRLRAEFFSETAYRDRLRHLYEEIA